MFRIRLLSCRVGVLVLLLVCVSVYSQSSESVYLLRSEPVSDARSHTHAHTHTHTLVGTRTVVGGHALVGTHIVVGGHTLVGTHTEVGSHTLLTSRGYFASDIRATSLLYEHTENSVFCVHSANPEYGLSPMDADGMVRRPRRIAGGDHDSFGEGEDGEKLPEVGTTKDTNPTPIGDIPIAMLICTALGYLLRLHLKKRDAD